MGKKEINWNEIGFAYHVTDKRYVANYKNGAWDEGGLTDDANIVLNECAGILQYCQEVFEGLKAYTTVNGDIVTFRPDLNAERMMDSAKRMPWSRSCVLMRTGCRPTAAAHRFTFVRTCSLSLPSSV